jgi:hypothetical protein
MSNPCILKRKILGAKGKEDSIAYSVYENLFVLLFILTRAVWGTWYLLKVWDSEVTWLYILTASSIYAVSWFWIFVIAMKVIKKFSGSSDPFVKKIVAGMKWLRNNKAVLLVMILMVSFALPALLTQALHVNFVSVDVNGFRFI